MIPSKIVSEDFARSLLNAPPKEPQHHNFKSKVGCVYGLLEVLSYSHKEKEHWYLCRCSCGNYCLKSQTGLNNRLVKSCGCNINKTKQLDLIVMKEMIPKELSVVQAKEGVRSKWVFNCKEHGNFEAVFQQVAYKKTSCPGCAITGYNPNIKGHFYINSLKFDNQTIAYKFGITNQEPSKRLKQLQSKTNLEIESLFYVSFEDGQMPIEIEKLFKSILPTKYLSKSVLPVGYTETVHPMCIIGITETLIKILN